MKNFINIRDISKKDLKKIIFDSKIRKKKRSKLNNLDTDKDIPLKGKFLIQMFEKSSTRTRLSFYLAIRQLGGGVLNLRKDELHFGEGGESIHDTAKILSNYGDIFMFRTDSDKKLQEFKRYIKIPIINGLSPSSHPTQILSDIFTIEEIKKQTKVNMTDLNEKLGIEVKIPDPLKRRVATRQYSNRTRNHSSQVSRKRMSARNRYAKRKNKIQPITRSYFSSKKRW